MTKGKDVHEGIMRIVVEAVGSSVEDGCTANKAIEEFCNDVFEEKWKTLIECLVCEMSMEEFMKIKEIYLGNDYPAYAVKYKFCKCENK